jgi:hypothetical protein
LPERRRAHQRKRGDAGKPKRGVDHDAFLLAALFQAFRAVLEHFHTTAKQRSLRLRHQGLRVCAFQ